MIINISEHKELLDLASSMDKNGFLYVAFPVEEMCNADTWSFLGLHGKQRSIALRCQMM